MCDCTHLHCPCVMIALNVLKVDVLDHSWSPLSYVMWKALLSVGCSATVSTEGNRCAIAKVRKNEEIRVLFLPFLEQDPCYKDSAVPAAVSGLKNCTFW